jgi:hypothetical protein
MCARVQAPRATLGHRQRARQDRLTRRRPGHTAATRAAPTLGVAQCGGVAQHGGRVFRCGGRAPSVGGVPPVCWNPPPPLHQSAHPGSRTSQIHAPNMTEKSPRVVNGRPPYHTRTTERHWSGQRAAVGEGVRWRGFGWRGGGMLLVAFSPVLGSMRARARPTQMSTSPTAPEAGCRILCRAEAPRGVGHQLAAAWGSGSSKLSTRSRQKGSDATPAAPEGAGRDGRD